jgi:hypothetical protein
VYKPASLAFRVPKDGWWLKIGLRATTGGQAQLVTDVILTRIPAGRKSTVVSALAEHGFRRRGDYARRTETGGSVVADTAPAEWLVVITKHIDEVFSCGALEGLVRVHGR